MSNSATPGTTQSMEFSRPGYWSGYPVSPPGDLPNPGLWHCGQILYQLSHQGSPRKLEWVAYPFSSESSRPRNRTQGSPALQADSLPIEPPESTRNLAVGQTQLTVQPLLAPIQTPTSYILGNLLRSALRTRFPSSLFSKGYPRGRLLFRIRLSQQTMGRSGLPLSGSSRMRL